MKRKWTLTIALFQTMGLLAADYTADDVAKLLDDIDIRQPSLPVKLPDYPKLEDHVMTCRKCGKKMKLKTEPSLMKALVDKIASKKNDVRYTGNSQIYIRFTLDDSRLCPHCGDGKYYIQFTEQFPIPAFSPLPLRLRLLEVPQIPQTLPFAIPVTEEDLLLLCEQYFPNKDTRRNFPFSSMQSPLSQKTSTFTTITEEDYQKYYNRNNRYQTISFLTNYGQNRLMSKHPIASYARNLLRQQLFSDNAAMFQKLTENASVLRKEDLQSFLKQTKDLYHAEHGFQHHYAAFTRMMVLYAPYLPLTCPKCHSRFYTANESQRPFMQPIGDLLCLTANFDLTPDYSSLCPYCHPEAMQPRLLDVQFTIDGKAYSSSVSPHDLNLLYLYCCRSNQKNNDMAMANQMFGRRSSESQKPTITAGNLLRLRSILQGVPDTSKISAIPYTDDAK
ncbi:MAG: hypothetical protein IKP58_00895 [Victivallales bacterium]|nr:hypothetical protein [Victivallales bacterium]